MVENEEKGWFGSFSSAGRNSAEKYRVLSKNEYENFHKRRAIARDFFTPDEDDGSRFNDSFEEKIDLFSKEMLEKVNSSSTSGTHKRRKKIYKSNSTGALPKERLKYHNKHKLQAKDKPKKEVEPPCTKYHPKMEYVWNRTIVGPKWNTKTSRKPFFQEKIDEKDFYLSHEDLAKTNKKCFVDMKKQTMRNGFPVRKDLRIRYEKKYDPNFRNNTQSNADIKSISSLSSPTSMTKSNQFPFSSRKKFLRKSALLGNKKLSSEGSKKNLLGVPDFSKGISREKRDRIFSPNHGKVVEQFHSPNYSQTFEKSPMMVSYSTSHIRSRDKDNENLVSAIKFDPAMSYNFDKCFDKYNNHKTIHSMSFKNMLSRPNGDDPLPSYMKGIYSKASWYGTTEKTLKMNNYANSKTHDSYTSFFPKRSYNKNINLNLLNSDKIDVKTVDNKNEFTKLTNFLMKTMKYYKRFDDLYNGTDLKKFDNISLRTNKRTKKEKERARERIAKLVMNYESSKE